MYAAEFGGKTGSGRLGGDGGCGGGSAGGERARRGHSL